MVIGDIIYTMTGSDSETIFTTTEYIYFVSYKIFNIALRFNNNIDNTNIYDDFKFISGDNDVKPITPLHALHIIDHGSVLYLIIPQILFYNQ